MLDLNLDGTRSGHFVSVWDPTGDSGSDGEGSECTTEVLRSPFPPASLFPSRHKLTHLTPALCFLEI